MPPSSVDPVTAIAEDAATGSVAELYSDIRGTLGVPVVNLIWRHLATIPGGLEYAWTSLKPVYVSNAAAREAQALNQVLNIPQLPGLSDSTLAAAGLSATDLQSIATVIASYERSNARNLVAMSALLARLNGSVTSNDSSDSSAVSLRPVSGQMPPLPAMDDMTPSVSALVNDMNQLGQRMTVMPTMYRHLSHWPAYLAQLHVLLKPLDADGRLERMILTAVAESERRGVALSNELSPAASRLEPKSKDQVLGAVRLFIDEPISKMTAIGGLVASAMPGTNQATG